MRAGLSLLLVILLYPPGAAASECIGLFTRHLLSGSQAVFIGEVTSIARNGQLDEIGFQLKQTFKFKFPPRNPLLLTQWATSGTTDYFHRFQIGSTYLVFARDNSDGSGWPAPRGYTSRGCDAWETNTPEAKKRISELKVLMRNRQFGRGVSR